jgi:uncharacterized membrane protein
MKPKRQRTIRYLLEGGAVLLIAVLASLVIALFVTRPPIPYNREDAAFSTTVQAKVAAILEEDQGRDGDLVTVYQKLRLRITTRGPRRGEEVTVTYNGMGPSVQAVRFAEGSRALVMITEMPTTPAGITPGERTEPASSPGASAPIASSPEDAPPGDPAAGTPGVDSSGDDGSGTAPETRTLYQVADHVRLLPLGLMAGLFAVITVGIGRWQGVRALLGLALSGLLIGGFILPQILAHRDPVLVTLLSSALLLAVTLYLIQGWNPAGHTALMGMVVSLAVTGGLAMAWTRLSYLTGFGSEETLFLQSVGVGVQMRGLLLAGMILGAAGVLDDVVIAQAVTVFELNAADVSLGYRELYRRGMRVGVTHLTSMVNTLVLAYASTALPLIILFYLYPEPWYLTINRELIAEEVVRTLVGSVGLMLAVPLTTAIAAWVAPLFQAAEAQSPT